MKISTFDLNLFVVLNAIYSEGSLTKAAEVVGITQPAVSNALSRLREKFDDDLFIRTGSGMTPTQKTENIILDVKKALDLMQKSVNEPDEFNPKTSELTFRISWSRCIFSFWVVGVFRGFLGGRSNNNPKHQKRDQVAFSHALQRTRYMRVASLYSDRHAPMLHMHFRSSLTCASLTLFDCPLEGG